MALIEVKQLRKTFHMGEESIHALDSLSFSIEEGELVAITGPSGCGKSTLMNILGLLDSPEGGSYRLAGKEVAQLTDDERATHRNQFIGFVFQNFNLLPRMSALRNVEMPLVYKSSNGPGLPRAERRVRAVKALDSVDLSNRLEHQPNELSGGQRQRVAIARALVNEPRLLLADEPTGNLDSRSGVAILTLFKDLNQKGITVVVVTHDPGIAEFAARVIAMRDGKIQSDKRK